MAELRLEDFPILDAERVEDGHSVATAWDDALGREVRLWLFGGGFDADRAHRLKAWAQVDIEGLAIVHGSGPLPAAGRFIAISQRRGVPLHDWLASGASASACAGVFAALVRVVDALRGEPLALPESTAAVSVDADGRPTIEVIDLEREASDEERFAWLRERAAELDLPRQERRWIDEADDVASLRAHIERAEATTARRLAGPTLALLAIAGVVGLGVLVDRSRPLEAELDTCAVAAMPARDWLVHQAPTSPPELHARLRARTRAWATEATESCRAAQRHEISEQLASQRLACIDERHAAMRGLAAALDDDVLARSPRPMRATLDEAFRVVGPPDACRWSPEEGYLYAPRARGVEASTADIEQVAVAWSFAVIGDRSSLDTALGSVDADALPPHWAGWATRARARGVEADAQWRAENWQAFTAFAEAGEDLVALDVLLDRAADPRAQAKTRETARALADAWLRRIESHIGATPRVQSWLTPRRERLAALESTER